MFIIEARRRAAIEAECESELTTMMDDDDNDSDDSGTEKNKNSKRRVVEIRADHIAKVAAELLMDLS